LSLVLRLSKVLVVLSKGVVNAFATQEQAVARFHGSFIIEPISERIPAVSPM
jgi:hypothetical protein